MSEHQDLQGQNRLAEARKSYTGKSLTDGQFAESWALAGIMERNIRTSGSFRDKLGDYAHAYARSEKFDAVKGEVIIRDIFKARYGQTMNQMREDLKAREDKIKDSAKEQAIIHARRIEPLIRDGDTMPFYQAYNQEASQMAKNFGITEAGAKMMMRDAYRDVEGRELYETGKALEEKYHRPKQEFERQSRSVSQDQSRPRSR